MTAKIPRNKENDYTREAAEARREFAKEQTNAELNHVGQYSFDPSVLPGNIEHFIGAAQVPIGLAGPLLVNGEYAKGEFFVPLATTEGTLVASYNRGMKLLRESGGVTATVVDDAMQRAPVFVFKSAREAQQFGVWVKKNFAEIKAKAETTTSVGKLRDIQQFPAARFLYLRFNYTTGDAAGQNMVGKATRTACDWIKSVYEGIERYQLEGSFATDKKTSWVNTLNTRGKKVIAEATISAAKLKEIMHVSVEQIFEARLDIATRRIFGGREQQRGAFGKRHHGDFYRLRAGCRQRRRIVSGGGLRGNHQIGRLLFFGDDSVTNRRYIRRRNGFADSVRMPRIDGLLRRRPRKKIRRNHRGDRFVRRIIARHGSHRRRMGFVARTAWTQPINLWKFQKSKE